MLYRFLVKPILFHFDPEKVHDAFTAFGEWAGRHVLARWLISFIYGYHGPDISRTVDGLRYRLPLILSAGFDYNARLVRILPSLAFGGVEVGSVTARPCAGNARPRLTRLVRSESILVNKGLRNDGVEAIITRLAGMRRDPDFVIGVSIARTNAAETASTEAGIADYFYTYQRLNETDTGDYYTLNISCPNAFGGEDFATPTLLDQLLTALRRIPSTKPLYLKLPIGQTWDELAALIRIGLKHRINGIIIGNLQKDYTTLDYPDEAPHDYRGGLSGKPTQERSLELIRRAHLEFGDQITLIGCGGILSPGDAQEKLGAGADLLQLITGMIFHGPDLMRRIAWTLAKRPKSFKRIP